jgi:Ras-related protein Rab-6A
MVDRPIFEKFTCPMYVVGEEKVAFRVVMIGDSSVGKTSIISRFLRDTFDTEELSTIGVLYDSFVSHCNGYCVEIQLWDTAGQEQYRALGPVYYRNAAAAIVVFDVSNRVSFHHLADWMRAFRNVCADTAVVIVVANKCDRGDRTVPTEEGKAAAKAYDAAYVETSAKTGQGVQILFDELVQTLAPSVVAAEGSDPRKTLLMGQEDERKQCC